MRNKLLLSLAFFFILFSLNNVSSWGPNTHLNMSEAALSQENTTLIAKIITDNYDACLSGLVYADVGIFEYYTNFKAYKGLHNYNTVDEMLRIATSDRQRAFAYCFKIHLAEDGISHNYFIPASIKSTHLPNYVIHPIKELSAESAFGIDPRANRLMENHAEFDDFVTKAAGRDWTSEAIKLNTILGGGAFYSQGFTPSSDTIYGKMQRTFFKFIGNFVSAKDAGNYYDMSIEASRSVLRGETPREDPSGEKNLMESDKNSALFLYLVTFIIIGIIFFIGFKFRLIGWSRR